ncbi:MAG: phosphotransferase, partial [Planctomycetales bacterium]|nr:phosphotransferase [Planctomycetales bacterium]
IEERMEQELGLLQDLGVYLDERCSDLGIPALDYEEAFRQVADKLRHEVRLDREQRHLADAAVTYRNDSHVQIPEVWADVSTPRITAMQRVSGGKITDNLPADNQQRRQIAARLAHALIARPIFSREASAVFHGDPHAGNIFLTDDGRAALLDWSLVGRLTAEQRADVMQVMLGGVTQDAARIATALARVGDHRLNPTALSAVVQTGLRRIREGRFPGLKWLLEMLDEAVATAGLRVDSDLLLFRKSLFTLDGVVQKIAGADFQIDEVLLREFLIQFAVEWPSRWFALPHTRNYATRLSNWDLTRTVLGLPWTCSRLWLQDVLSRVAAPQQETKVHCT